MHDRVAMAFLTGLRLTPGLTDLAELGDEGLLAKYSHHFDQSRLYHEAHITIEPVPDTGPGHAEFDIFRDAFSDDEWRVSSFSEDDVDGIEGKWFITSRSQFYSEMVAMVRAKVTELEGHGLTVLRYKIEDTLLDSKHGDSIPRPPSDGEIYSLASFGGDRAARDEFVRSLEPNYARLGIDDPEGRN